MTVIKFVKLHKMAVLRNLLALPLRNRNIRCGVFNQGSTRSIMINNQLFGAAYDPDGKTVVHILNNEENAPLMVNGYSMLGFRLNNGLFAFGPIAIFPRSVLSWNVKDDEGINERSLSLFVHLFPKLDVLVIGLSDARDHQRIAKTREIIHKLMKSKGITTNIEVLPTEKAVTTFNFLNSEDRYVGGAMIPPIYYTPTEDDQYCIDYITKKRDQRDFLLET